MLIYNTKTNLEYQDLNRLRIVSHLVRELSLNSNSSKYENENQLNSEAPDFVCIMRDSLLKQPYSPNDTISKFLQTETTNSSNALRNDKVKKQIKSMFKSFDCFRLPVPVVNKTIKSLTKEEALQMLDEINYDDLRDKFKLKFDEMCEALEYKFRAKSVNKTYLNGFKLAEYMKLIVNLINNKKCVYLHETLVAAINREANFTLEKCKEIYHNKMSEFKLKNFELTQKEFEEKDYQVAKECLIRLKKILKYNPLTLNEYNAKFYKFRNEKFNELFRQKRNTNKSEINKEYRNKISSRSSSDTSTSEYLDEYKNDFDDNSENDNKK